MRIGRLEHLVQNQVGRIGGRCSFGKLLEIISRGERI
jgi:hypothetical protein